MVACGWSVPTEPKLRLKREIRSESNEKREQEGQSGRRVRKKKKEILQGAINPRR